MNAFLHHLAYDFRTGIRDRDFDDLQTGRLLVELAQRKHHGAPSPWCPDVWEVISAGMATPRSTDSARS